MYLIDDILYEKINIGQNPDKAPIDYTSQLATITKQGPKPGKSKITQQARRLRREAIHPYTKPARKKSKTIDPQVTSEEDVCPECVEKEQEKTTDPIYIRKVGEGWSTSTAPMPPQAHKTTSSDNKNKKRSKKIKIVSFAGENNKTAGENNKKRSTSPPEQPYKRAKRHVGQVSYGHYFN